MLKEERFEHILSMIKKSGKITYEQVSKELDVSIDTIRRDIELLNNNGLLVKARGGAISRAKHPLSFQERTGILTSGKNIIALKAQQFIKADQTIFMDGGTTLCAIGARLPLNLKCRVITNNHALVSVLAKLNGIEVILLGGRYNRETATTEGVETCAEARNYIVDLYLMGTCSIDAGFGITADYREDAALKRIIFEAAQKTVAVSNHEKLNSTEPFRVCGLNEIDTLITDLPGDHKKLDGYRNLGLKLI
ncbi:MAG TPA: DeoR/GlpR family DNA-binding transcription regulator [Flavitalea sp.]|nr:DeoR/GlpR family DNA-binding transcription regulator [Flavitalea sp.]